MSSLLYAYVIPMSIISLKCIYYIIDNIWNKHTEYILPMISNLF